MATTYELTFKDYLYIARRRAPYLASAFVGVLAVAIAVAVLSPPVYQATGTIMVEAQQISGELLPSTAANFADERIEVIKQRVMTRDNLLKIADKYQLYKGRRQSLTTSELIDEMRSSMMVELISADVRKAGGTSVIAFKVSFENDVAQVAYQVANELVTLFLAENVKARTERASETTAFLLQEGDKLKKELETLESQVAAYKQEHKDALPEHRDLRMGMLQRTEADLQNVDREYKAAQEELRYLEIELAASKAGVNSTGPGQAVYLTPAQELEKLKIERVKLLSMYKPNHPDVRAVEQKIEVLEKTIQETPGFSTPQSAADLLVARIQAKIATANTKLTSLAKQQERLRQQRADLEREILQSPQVERGMVALMRDHENAKRKYEEIRAKQMSAQIAENLEGEKKAERFVLLEPPLLPEKPIKPNRKKMVAAGFAFAIASSGGLLVVLESLDQRVRGVQALTALSHHKPLVSIPYITTQSEFGRRQRIVKRLILIGCVLAVIALIALHFLYMPLDIIFAKIMSRFE